MSVTAKAVPTLYMDDNFKEASKPTNNKPSSSSSVSRSSSGSGNSSSRRCAFTRKCSRLVREHRARFYIMRRCVTMLICWRDYSDS